MCYIDCVHFGRKRRIMAQVMNNVVVKYILDELVQGRKVKCNQLHPVFTKADFQSQIQWLYCSHYHS